MSLVSLDFSTLTDKAHLFHTGNHPVLKPLFVKVFARMYQLPPINCENSSQILEQLLQSDGLPVIGAEYDLATGAVDFFDGVPNEV